MIILLIAEARSGSTNLAKWLKASLPHFQLLNEPYNFSSDVKIDITKNYIISEKFYFNQPLMDKLIGISDISFCLYRENTELQIESYLTALSTDNWYGEYNKIVLDDSSLKSKDDFLENKIKFKEFISNSGLKYFTYEDLYCYNKIDELQSFLGITSNVKFPYGKKYRKENNKTIL